MFSSQN